MFICARARNIAVIKLSYIIEYIENIIDELPESYRCVSQPEKRIYKFEYLVIRLFKIQFGKDGLPTMEYREILPKWDWIGIGLSDRVECAIFTKWAPFT